MHFPALHRHFPGGFDAKAHPVALNAQHRDDNVLVDEDAFRLLPAQNQHGLLILPWASFFLPHHSVRNSASLSPGLSVHFHLVDDLGHSINPGHSLLGDLLFVEAEQSTSEEKNSVFVLT
jgi:hypothetical protein